jgi:serine/threonine protein kinase
MHYQNPPLIHRDLKVENILLTPPQTYKLCDFGSTTTPMPREKVPTAVEAIQKMELEINKTTTLQYRAPELVDVWGRKGYDEKIGELGSALGLREALTRLSHRYLGPRSTSVQALLLHHSL